MLELAKRYTKAFFPRTAIQSTLRALGEMGGNPEPSLLVVTTRDGRTWTYDSIDEFFAEYVRDRESAEGSWYGRKSAYFFSLSFDGSDTRVRVKAPSRGDVERVFAALEENSPQSTDDAPRGQPRIFIGHGHANDWRDLKDHLADQHGYEIEAYETGARAGHAIRDILESMMASSSFALLVMTPEDFMAGGEERARQNVVHEAGLFQGRLGFDRAVIIAKKGLETFTNIDGIQRIEYEHEIRETFGDVLATLRREFQLRR